MSIAKPIRVGKNARKRVGNPNPGKKTNLRKLTGASVHSVTGPLGRIPGPVVREATNNSNAVNGQGNRGINGPAATTRPSGAIVAEDDPVAEGDPVAAADVVDDFPHLKQTRLSI